MSTKGKLSRNKGPPPKIVKPETMQSTLNSSSECQKTASGLDREAEDQFELELCWCIQQLEAGLADIKLQDKQVYNMTKSLNVLKSHNASLIKKRQVMRNTFGDYRSKMTQDEKKFGKISTVVKFVPSNNKKLEKKSLFIKKAHASVNSSEKDELKLVNEQFNKDGVMNPDVSNEQFRFNFSYSES